MNFYVIYCSLFSYEHNTFKIILHMFYITTYKRICFLLWARRNSQQILCKYYFIKFMPTYRYITSIRCISANIECCHNVAKGLWYKAMLWQHCDNIGIITGMIKIVKSSILHCKRRIETSFQLLINRFVSFCIIIFIQCSHNIVYDAVSTMLIQYTTLAKIQSKIKFSCYP